MELTLKNIGSTANFVTWLKSFKDIDPDQTIIIEVDIDNQEFVAKGFPVDKAVVKYSKITFENAGYEMTGLIDGAGVPFDWSKHDSETDGRVKIAILKMFGKVIDVISMFTETPHDMNIRFDIDRSVKYKKATETCSEYSCITWSFISKALKMNINCSQLTEFFQKLTDDLFINKICNIGSPSVYEVNIASLNNLAKISSVLSTDKSKDRIKFYSKTVDGQRVFFAKDATKAETYDYQVGYYTAGVDGDTATIVSKENFISATKGLNVDTLELVLDTAGASRIIINVPDAKIVVGAIKQ